MILDYNTKRQKLHRFIVCYIGIQSKHHLPYLYLLAQIKLIFTYLTCLSYNNISCDVNRCSFSATDSAERQSVEALLVSAVSQCPSRRVRSCVSSVVSALSCGSVMVKDRLSALQAVSHFYYFITFHRILRHYLFQPF